MTIHRQGSSNRNSRRGVTLVEVALGLGMVIAITFGCVEFGYYFYTTHMMSEAAAAGAWNAGLANSTNTTVSTAVANALTAGKMTNCGYTVTTVPADITTAPPGTTITVTVACTWGTASRGFRPMGYIGTGKSVSATAVAISQPGTAQTTAGVNNNTSATSSGGTSSGGTSWSSGGGSGW